MKNFFTKIGLCRRFTFELNTTQAEFIERLPERPGVEITGNRFEFPVSENLFLRPQAQLRAIGCVETMKAKKSGSA